MTNVTYVSALYNCYNTAAISERLLKDVSILLQQDLDLIIFVDEFYQQELAKLDKSASVKIITYDISKLTIYNIIMANKNGLSLPEHRSVSKDTYEYMALMHSKIELIKLAQDHTLAAYVAWIDAGSSKMICDPEMSYHRLRNLRLQPGLKVLIPGCYQRNPTFDQLLANVWWNYLGTFFVCERSAIEAFYQYSMQALFKFCASAYVVWEVNVWIDINKQHPEIFTWYASDHNDSFTHIPPQYRVTETSSEELDSDVV